MVVFSFANTAFPTQVLVIRIKKREKKKGRNGCNILSIYADPGQQPEIVLFIYVFILLLFLVFDLLFARYGNGKDLGIFINKLGLSWAKLSAS